METVKRMDQERSIWKLLPLHPQPQWLESLSSYIIRLAEANGFQSTDDLATLSGIWSWKYAHAALDYSAYCAEKVARIAGCASDILWNATFYHLVRHFAFPALYVRETRRFLQGSIATSLRYCPLCLAENPYGRLCWRFLAIPGCHKHICSLLSTCGHCGMPVPLLPHVPRLTVCATCQGDLRSCHPAPLPPQRGRHLQRRTHDLELLLMPAGWAPEITQALAQGSGFLFLRQRKQLSRAEVASRMGREEQVLREIEAGNWGERATLADYWQYTEILDCSLSEVIEAAQIVRDSEQERKRSRLDDLTLRVQLEELSRPHAKRFAELSASGAGR